MIILRPWSYDRAFVVIVILIPDIPIEPVVQLDSEPGFRRLEAHRLRSDQRAGNTGRISYPASLTGVFIDSISGKQRRARSQTGHRFNIEEVIPHVVKAVAERMLNAVEEIVDDRLAVNPMVIVAGANREPRSSGPIE